MKQSRKSHPKKGFANNINYIADRSTNYQTFAITIQPESKRFQNFLTQNNHLDIQQFSGILGKDLSRQERISSGLITADLASRGINSDGQIGAAASHRKLWQLATKTENGILILEDDVITHPELNRYIERNIEELKTRDITLFSINTDSIMTIVTPQGLIQTMIFSPQHPSPDWITKALQSTSINNIEMMRLIHGFGLSCYFISPRGAQRCLERVFPLTMETTLIPIINKQIAGIGTDRRLNAIYSNINGAISYPFLAYTPNTDSTK